MEGSIDVNINAEGTTEETVQSKEKPIWLSDATSLITTNITSSESPTPQVCNVITYIIYLGLYHKEYTHKQLNWPAK